MSYSRFLLVGMFFLIPAELFGQAGFALQFNAQTTYALVPRHNAFNSERVTIETWINPEQCIAQDRWDAIINKPYTQHVAPHYQWLLARGLDGNVSISFTIDGVSRGAHSDAGVLELDRWSHLAGTYDGQFIRIYLNGEQVGQFEAGGAITGYDTDVSIGQLGNFPNVALDKYNGVIDEVRVWNYARSEEQIQQTINVSLAGDEDGLVGYWRFDEGEGQRIADSSPTGNHGRLGHNDGQDAADPQWVESDAPIYSGLAELSTGRIEFGPVPSEQTVDRILTVINIADVDDDWHALTFSLTDQGGAPNWLAIDPSEGRIPVGDTLRITFTANTEGLDLGEYERTVLFESNAMNALSLEIPVHIFVVEGFGRLFGQVYDAVRDVPVRGAVVQIPEFGYVAEANDNGNYEFRELPAWAYDVIATAPDYLSMWEEDVEIGAGDEVRLDFPLLYATCDIDPDRINISLAPNDHFETILTIHNRGSGPLTWSAERRFPNAGIEPWELRNSFNAEEISEDNQLNGVVCVGGRLYVSGGNNGEDVNKIYVFNQEGELIRQFDQFFESRYGMRDLTYDGELIWGADDNILFGFNTEGELIRTIGGHARSYRALVWDPVNEVFWSADVTSDIFATSMNGEVVRTIDVPVEERVYGLAYCEYDPDGYELYIATRSADGYLQFDKIDLDNDRLTVAVMLDLADTRPGGISITNQYDPYNWVLTGLIQSPDRVAVWQLDQRTDWLTIEPNNGTVEANRTAEIAVEISSAAMLEETEMEAELVFTHDGVGGGQVVPVNLEVMVGGISQREIRFNIGWNLISLNILPEIDNASELFQPLADDGILIIAKDGAGRFYMPSQDFNNMVAWHSLEGYMAKLTEAAELSAIGEAIARETEIELSAGWNMVSYLPRFPIDATVALSGLGDNLIIAKDGYGGFFIPAWDFSSMGDMREEQGYFLKVNEDATLVYQIEERAAGLRHESRLENLRWIAKISPTSSSFSLLLIETGLEPGARLEAFTESGLVAGRGVVDEHGRCGITLWGDDPTTAAIDGFIEGENLMIRTVAGEAVKFGWIDGHLPATDGWTADGWGVAAVDRVEIPQQFGIAKTYPNPFNRELTVEFSLARAGSVSLQVFDLTGRHVGTLLSGRLEAGIHRSSWRADDLSSGIYLLKFETQDESASRKIVLLK